MYIILQTKSFNIYNILFGKKQNNTIVSYCYFTNIMYSTPKLTLSNVLFEIELVNVKYTIIDNNTTLVLFDVNQPRNKDTITTINQIETSILKNYSENHNKKYIQNNITNQLLKGVIKLHSGTNKIHDKFSTKLILRISGIWENSQDKVGIIYKFIFPRINNLSTYVTS